ncbi:acyl carrier protein [Serratia plymuthica]|nr:acyl carrier protein [Serratia plymuthica]
MNRNEVITNIKEKIIFEDLELSEWGHELLDIKDDTLLLSEEGLALDSVDVLDIFVGIQKEYGIDLGEITKELMEKHCQSPLTLTELVIDKCGAR